MKLRSVLSFLTAATVLTVSLAGCSAEGLKLPRLPTRTPLSMISPSGGSEDGLVSSDPGELSDYVHQSLESLAELGIDATAREDELTEEFLGFFEGEDYYNDRGTLLGLLLSQIYFLEDPPRLLWWDTEVFELESMYTDFLTAVDTLSASELGIANISEDNSRVDWDSGTGTKTVSFDMLGKSFSYKADFQSDWMDTGIVPFLNDCLEEAGSDKLLYACDDGYQAIILFYNTPEWAESYNKAFPELALSSSNIGSGWDFEGLFW